MYWRTNFNPVRRGGRMLPLLLCLISSLPWMGVSITNSSEPPPRMNGVDTVAVPPLDTNQFDAELTITWRPWTRHEISRFGNATRLKLISEGYSDWVLSNQFWSKMGESFEKAALSSLESVKNEQEFNGVKPDAVGIIYNGKWWNGFRHEAHFVEVKISERIPNSYNRQQLDRMVEYLADYRIANADIVPVLTLVTPTSILIDPAFIDKANKAGITLLHRETEYLAENKNIIRIKPARHINAISAGITTLSLHRLPGSPARMDY